MSESQNKILQLAVYSAIVFWYDLFLEDRAEILEKMSLFFGEIWRHQKDILKLTDL